MRPALDSSQQPFCDVCVCVAVGLLESEADAVSFVTVSVGYESVYST